TGQLRGPGFGVNDRALFIPRGLAVPQSTGPQDEDGCNDAVTLTTCPPGISCDNFCRLSENYETVISEKQCCNGLTADCKQGIYCDNQGCKPCGYINEPCCDATNPCYAGYACVNSICVCGGPGQPCCEGSNCNDSGSLVCNAGTCVPC